MEIKRIYYIMNIILNNKMKGANMSLTSSIIKTELKRKSGILMHISSLPGPFGIGTLGVEAREFAEFLVETGQKYWQMLPIGPTGYGDSPYSSYSTYAGNPYFIDLDNLVERKLLIDYEIWHLYQWGDVEKVDFDKISKERMPVFKLAFSRFNLEDEDFIKFKEENINWLEDYSLFMAIKDSQEGKSWIEWDEDLKKRNEFTLKKFKEDNRRQYEFYNFLQYIFFSQWKELKEFVEEKNILLIGDLPIYVAEDSADVWSHPEVFKLDENLKPKVVGGVPPDYFSKEGQLWGNPIYNWDYLEKNNYKWWLDRIKWNKEIFDVLRFDHFRGFESFWEIPYGEETAINGKWVKGPGMKFFNKIKTELGNIDIIAEDLGDLTDEVIELVEESGFPGMNILQFAFGARGDSEYLPHNCKKNSVMYVGTHDNDTIIGWLNSGDPEEIEFAREYFNLTLDETYNWGMIRGALTSPANLCITQMQDILLLDNSARMNSPGILDGNWSWRMRKEDLGTLTKLKLEKLTRISGRFNKSQQELDAERAIEEAIEIALEQGVENNEV